ncbi:glycoside hydrolase family 39 protein [Glonium stellatum]|uniref:Glycoside hydrolase family 39 protein n=1 Tax=Glonium stellatum TaxID=574774 RepID=A0A8E2JTH8_9PEZI|nr:glycoside hydrolase family 39 protein [Glonium stellatum]
MTVGSDMVRTLVGVRISTGTWQLQINDLTAVGLPARGNLNIHTWGFLNTGGHYGEVDYPNDLGWYSHAYSGNSVAFPVYQTDTSAAYAFEFYVGFVDVLLGGVGQTVQSAPKF